MDFVPPDDAGISHQLSPGRGSPRVILSCHETVKPASPVKGAVLNTILILDYFSYFAYTTPMKYIFSDSRTVSEALSMPEAQE
jgi:hypothetical protein